MIQSHLALHTCAAQARVTVTVTVTFHAFRYSKGFFMGFDSDSNSRLSDDLNPALRSSPEDKEKGGDRNQSHTWR